MASEYLPDVFGPDGVRVTICVEPAVERLIRERDAWTAPKITLLRDPARAAMRRLLPELIQTRALKGRWVVVLEADSGEKLRLSGENRNDALSIAEDISQRVHHQGLRALEDTERS